MNLPMRSTRSALVLLAALAFCALAALPRQLAGDEIPAEKRARGKRETILAGIDLAHRSLRDVKRLYGPPDKVDKTPTPPGFSEIEYTWERPGRNKLAVRTRNADGEPERLVEIDVWGSRPLGRTGRTGQGLTLGCSMDCVEKVYGRRYEVLRPAEEGNLAVWLAWDEDFNLTLDFDQHQRIDHLQISRNEDD
jgi:hypothetical protein